MNLPRRSFLALAAAILPAGILPRLRDAAALAQPAAARPTLDGFLALSARLTGRTNPDRDLGRAYLDGLLADPSRIATVAALVAGAPVANAARDDLERRILTAWYTGVHDVGGRTVVVTHDAALMWSALGRPAPGLCASGFGEWSTAPVARR